MRIFHSFSLIVLLLHVTGCTLNYPKRSDAELFLPLITGLDSTVSEETMGQSADASAFRVSKALEHQYIANSLEDIPTVRCAVDPPTDAETVPEEKGQPIYIQITKVLEEMNWQSLKENRGIFEDSKGGVLFGHGVSLPGATLLNLRYALSPLEDERYLWNLGDRTLDIPYKYVKLEDISMRQEALDLLTRPTRIFKHQIGNDYWRELEDHENVIIAADQPMKATGETARLSRVRIEGVRRCDISFSDGPSLSRIRFCFEDRSEFRGDKQGWLDVVDLSYFPEGSTYMDVVRALTLAQGGDCDSAYSVYRHAEPDLDPYLKIQVLMIIAHLRGRAGDDISAVLTELAATIPTGNESGNDEERHLFEQYRNERRYLEYYLKSGPLTTKTGGLQRD